MSDMSRPLAMGLEMNMRRVAELEAENARLESERARLAGELETAKRELRIFDGALTIANNGWNAARAELETVKTGAVGMFDEWVKEQGVARDARAEVERLKGDYKRAMDALSKAQEYMAKFDVSAPQFIPVPTCRRQAPKPDCPLARTASGAEGEAMKVDEKYMKIARVSANVSTTDDCELRSYQGLINIIAEALSRAAAEARMETWEAAQIIAMTAVNYHVNPRAINALATVAAEFATRAKETST